MQIEDLSPATVGEDRIAVELADPETKPTALRPVLVNISYDAADPEGVVLPIEVLVQSPVAEGFEEKVFRHSKPTSYAFTPITAGSHLVLVREQAHNRWVGRLVIDVQGDRFGEAAN